jgi:hypothetical protein
VRGLAFDLTDDVIEELCRRPCAYCGISPATEINGYIYNGIDRIDPSIGYLAGNVAPCCKYCNVAKRTMNRDEFFAWVEQVYFYSAACADEPAGQAHLARAVPSRP